MDRSIWATWYDLAPESKSEYISWLHDEYLPETTAKPGFLWAAHYEVTGGGAHMNKITDQLARIDDPDIGTGSQYVMLVGASSPHTFFHPQIITSADGTGGDEREMFKHRIGTRSCIFVEEERVNGPEISTRAPGTTPGPAIQMGSFRTQEQDQEFDLAAWYTQYRLAAIARMPGAICARKMVSVAGWAKHSVMYEYTSLQARLENFQPHESLAMDPEEWTSRVIHYTLHAPGSPSIGHRIWPPVE